MTSAAMSFRLDRTRLEKLSDGLAAAIAISLPWSTTASGIFVVLWLLSLIPIADFPSLGHILKTPAGALPAALVAFAVIGALWADVSWIDRLHGINAFLKFLVIPLLMVRFSQSGRGHWVLNGLLASVTVLLVTSTMRAYSPSAQRFTGTPYGVPVHDYITQSSLFTIAVFVFLEMAAQAWKDRRVMSGVALLLLACAFLANILSIATARAAFVVIPVLLVLFCLRQATVKGALLIGVAALLVVTLAWNTSTYMQLRVGTIFEEVYRYQNDHEFTSAGFRLEFWKNGAQMVAEAPVIGHGTGSIRELYRRAIESGQSSLPTPTRNPHNQALAVTIQLGAAGLLLLLAMWIAHAILFFRGTSLLAWAGLVVVTQNVMSCLFTSSLFDFTMGWLYTVLAGTLAGVVLLERRAGSPLVPKR